eukprot:1142631-Amphidinium_carterae.1
MVPKILKNNRFVWGIIFGTLGLGRGGGRSSVSKTEHMLKWRMGDAKAKHKARNRVAVFLY